MVPTEPTIERAEAISSSIIDLKWAGATDNMGIAGYKIYRNNEEIQVTTKTEYRDTGLSPNTTYRYFVMAFDTSGNYSKISNVKVVTTLSAGFGHKISADRPFVDGLHDRLWFLREEYKEFTEKDHTKVPFLSQPIRHYIGAAWYQTDIDIPSEWENKRVELHLERTR